MRAFQHLAPAFRLFSGPDSLDQLGRELDRAGSRRALILCGRSVVRQDALVALLRDAIGARCAGLFDGVQAHSPAPAVQAAAEALRRAEADAVVAVGGGSASVTARAASILLAEGGDLRSLSTSRDATGRLRSPKLLAPKLPQFVVPTTPNTAVVKAGSAVFEPDSGQRLAMFDPKTRPQAVFLHPAMLASAPRGLVLSASLNTLVVTVEGLLSPTGDPFADALMMQALRLLMPHAQAERAADDDAARDDYAVAALMCGQGTDHTGFGVATVLSHAVASRFHIENGIAKAILLPHALRFNAVATSAGLAKLASCLDVAATGETGLESIIARTGAMARAFGAAVRLREVGVPREALASVAEAAMSDWFLRSNPRPVREAAELLGLLAQAW
jgi:alcohol dehydrogenase class IV